jgi:peptidoglycan/xylan/chitin deacetylase (PgdA/CDA1 family)
MRLPVSVFVLIGFLATSLAPAPAGERFVSVAFHDVVDFRGDLDEDAVTVDRLIGFFEWLRANHWTAISLDDVEAARLGKKPLPKHAILITFDDGYQSLYTRVFPLILAYRIPVICALAGVWMDAPMNATVRYGNQDVPRTNFLRWEEAQEMERSGLVEFASHSYDLHRGVRANPQGNELAAAWARIYRPGRGYESADEFRRRIAADLARSYDLLATWLSKKPRTIVWPFGRYNDTDIEVAKASGFTFALTLNPEPADVAKPMGISRYLPTNDPKLGELVSNLLFEDPLPAARRLVALDPATLWTGDDASMNERLGHAIERLRTLGATGIVLDAAIIGPDGRFAATWFPTRQLPVRADILSRLAWQCQSRAGVAAYVRLPAGAALRTLGDPAKVRALFEDLGAYVPVSGLFVDDTPGLTRLGDGARSSGTPWDVRAARDAAIGRAAGGPEALALSAFGIVESERPGLQLVAVGDSDPSSSPGAIADLTLVPVAPNPHAVACLSERLSASSWLRPALARRGGLWFTSDHPPAARDLAAATRVFQIHGGTAIGWDADDPVHDRPKAKIAGSTVSSSTFPVKF